MDDFVCCFQRKYEAEVFRQRLEERFAKYGLELAEEKTRILEFGRFAEQDRKRREEERENAEQAMSAIKISENDKEVLLKRL